eukprot:jgi/Galph1/3317/GphlegSOOS_G1979.1
MGANTSALLSEEIEEIAEDCQCKLNLFGLTATFNADAVSSKEIKRLYKRFQKLDRNTSGTIESEELYMIPELAMNPLAPRIVTVFDGVNFRHPKAPKSAKIDFAFRIYDIDNDGVISVNDLMEILHMMVGNNLEKSVLEEIAKTTIRESDTDQDDKISKEEFSMLMEKTDIDQSMSIHF